MTSPAVRRIAVTVASALLAIGAVTAVDAAPAIASATPVVAPGHVRLAVSLRSGATKGDVLRLQTPHGKSWATLATTHLDAHRQGGFTVSVPDHRRLRLYLEATKTHKSKSFDVDPSRLS